MADVALVNRAVTVAPKIYTLTGQQELELKAVSAVIDGSGATASYVAVLQMLAQDGTVMWSSPTESVIAAGGSANVSWFPGVDADSGGSGGGGGTQTFSGARVYRSTNQSIPNNTDTTVIFDTVRFDVGGFTNLGAHPTRLTAPVTGYYMIGGTAAFPNGDYYSQIVPLLNGSLVSGQLAGLSTSVPAGNPNLIVNVIWQLNQGDYVELDVVQSSGGPANLLSAPPQSPEFWIGLLGV